jgi:hypothetical protein
MKEQPSPRELAVARFLDQYIVGPERAVLVGWARRLLEIRASRAPALKKVRDALDTIHRAEVILPLVRSLAGALKDVIWEDRTWSARLGLGAAAARRACGRNRSTSWLLTHRGQAAGMYRGGEGPARR